MPMMRKDTKIGLSLGGGYMREGAMLLTEKDFPLFIGDFKPGFAGALVTKVKLGNVVDFSLMPAWIYQSGTMDSHAAVQIPMSLILKLGDVVQISAELGDVYRRSNIPSAVTKVAASRRAARSTSRSVRSLRMPARELRAS